MQKGCAATRPFCTLFSADKEGDKETSRVIGALNWTRTYYKRMYALAPPLRGDSGLDTDKLRMVE